jgi:hypothetical protein
MSIITPYIEEVVINGTKYYFVKDLNQLEKAVEEYIRVMKKDMEKSLHKYLKKKVEIANEELPEYLKDKSVLIKLD